MSSHLQSPVSCKYYDCSGSQAMTPTARSWPGQSIVTSSSMQPPSGTLQRKRRVRAWFSLLLLTATRLMTTQIASEISGRNAGRCISTAWPFCMFRLGGKPHQSFAFHCLEPTLHPPLPDTSGRVIGRKSLGRLEVRSGWSLLNNG